MSDNNLKFSVVVPTMWLANQYFLPLLSHLVNANAVGEILIVDNNPTLKPTDSILEHEKIKLLNYGTNLYYNKSVNLGVKESKFDLLCLLNDDTFFDPTIFTIISNSFKSKSLLFSDVGALFVHPAFFNKGEENLELIQKVQLAECNKLLDGFGCVMFMHKDNYIPIPEELVHHFGDVWVHETQLKNNKKNYFLINFVVHTVMRVSTAKVPEVRGVILNDWKIANKIFAEHGIHIEDTSNTFPVFDAGLLTRYA